MTKLKETANRIGKDCKEFFWAGVVFFIYYRIVHSVYDAFCPLLAATGIPCAGCGLTRAAVSLMQGQVQRAAHINPSLFPIIIFLLYCGYFRYIRGSKIRGFKVMLGLLVFCMLAVYVYRMYLYFPGRAPYVYQRNNVAAGWIPGYDKWMDRILNEIEQRRAGM